VPLIVDACVVAAWYLPDEKYDPAVQTRVIAEGIVVPRIWDLEIQNTFMIAERRGRITPLESDAAITDIFDVLTIEIEGASESIGAEMRLGRAYGLTSYDASYLELAIRRGLRIVSSDTKLSNAARAVGVLDEHSDAD
jgi:predicted nucleic acid-binding protein